MAIEPREPPTHLIARLRRALGGQSGWSGFALQVLFVARYWLDGYEIVDNARSNLEKQRITSQQLAAVFCTSFVVLFRRRGCARPPPFARAAFA